MFRERVDRRLLPTAALRADRLPAPDAPVPVLQVLAETFDAVRYHGNPANVLDSMDVTHARWADDTLGAAGAAELRTALLAALVLGGAPSPGDVAFARAVLEALRALVAAGASHGSFEEPLPDTYDLDARFPYRTVVAEGVSETFLHGTWWVIDERDPDAQVGLPIVVRGFDAEQAWRAHLDRLT